VNQLRRWIHWLERRWIPAPEARDRHETIVRARLAADGRPADPETAADDADAIQDPRRNATG
jgi:hypothetical protein